MGEVIQQAGFGGGWRVTIWWKNPCFGAGEKVLCSISVSTFFFCRLPWEEVRKQDLFVVVYMRTRMSLIFAALYVCVVRVGPCSHTADYLQSHLPHSYWEALLLLKVNGNREFNSFFAVCCWKDLLVLFLCSANTNIRISVMIQLRFRCQDTIAGGLGKWKAKWCCLFV